jgi:hypothetical protein
VGVVAVSDQAVPLDRSADRGPGEAVADLAGLERAHLLVEVFLGPAGIDGIRGAVALLDEVAGLVVRVLLDVFTEGVLCRGVRKSGAARVVVGLSDGCVGMAEVLAACRGDQAICGVVGVIAVGRDTGVLEEDRLLGGVADERFVPGRVVGVVEVLEDGRAWVTRTARGQPDQPEGVRVVGVAGCDGGAVAHASIEADALTLGVVVDLCYRMERRGRLIEQPLGQGGTIQPDIYLLEAAGDVVDVLRDGDLGLGLIAVGCD